MVFDLFLLGRNTLDLETSGQGFARRTSQFAWALLVMGFVILSTNYPLGSTVLFNPMLSALNYLWARHNPNARVSLFGLVTLPANLLPYAYLGFDVLRGGLPLAMQSATGLLAGHAWWVLAEAAQGGNPEGPARRLATPPGWLQALLPDSVAPEDVAAQAARDAPGGAGGRVASRAWGGTAFAPRGRNFGDGQGVGAWASGGGAAGQTIGGSGAGAATRGGSSWLPNFLGGGGGGGSTASTSTSATPAHRRDALLEATERRLRAQRESSIAGRNERAAPSGPAVVQGQAGGPSGGSTYSSGVPAASASSATLRSRTTGSGGGTGRLQHGQGRGGDSDEEEELDASSSGGAVAEQRRAEPRGGSGSKSAGGSGSGAADNGGGHQWGTGQRLGE